MSRVWKIERVADERHALMTMSYPQRHKELGRRRSRLWRTAWMRITR